MKSETRRLLRAFNETARGNSFAVYQSLIGDLCQEYSHFAWVKPLSGFVRNGDIQRLVDYADSLGEQQYTSPTEHFVANQFVALIKKYPFPTQLSPFDPKAKAMEKFWKAEEKCSQTNQFFGQGNNRPWLPEEFGRMRSFIGYVLGSEPDLASIWEQCDFGPGASLGVHGNATNLARKIGSDWSVTPAAYMYARSAIYRNWHLVEALNDEGPDRVVCLDVERLNKRFSSRVHIVSHNKIAFVPKTVKTFRSIAVEPLLNGFVQKGVDATMRKRLRRIGIDLSDQSINSRMAREGSLEDSDESFVTIDLASASDSISIGLCEELLPPAWYDLLNSIRSKSFLMDGKEYPYHKFCSMGNGFCFPLETLLFTAACNSVGCGKAGVDFHVYGDDIIVRKKFAKTLLDLLNLMGFEVNKDKTFISGPFRESCGTDWFNGEDVRPFILDEGLENLQAFFKFLNLTQRSARCSAFFEESWRKIFARIPAKLRFVRPYNGPADTAVTVSMDQFMTSPFAGRMRPSKQWPKCDFQAWEWSELITAPLSDKWTKLRNAHCTHMMAALRGSPSSMPFVMRRKTRTSMRRVSHGGATSTWLP